MPDVAGSSHGVRPFLGGGRRVLGTDQRFGSLVAVDDLTFAVAPGRVTGFLGPNGAGKTDDLADAARPGPADLGHRHHRRPRVRRPDQPLAVVGAALEATDVHPGRSGRDHLRPSPPSSASRAAGSTSSSR